MPEPSFKSSVGHSPPPDDECLVYLLFTTDFSLRFSHRSLQSSRATDSTAAVPHLEGLPARPDLVKHACLAISAALGLSRQSPARALLLPADAARAQLRGHSFVWARASPAPPASEAQHRVVSCLAHGSDGGAPTLYLAWRPSPRAEDWVPTRADPGEPAARGGAPRELRELDSAWQGRALHAELLDALLALLADPAGPRVVFAGHGLGAALALVHFLNLLALLPEPGALAPRLGLLSFGLPGVRVRLPGGPARARRCRELARGRALHFRSSGDAFARAELGYVWERLLLGGQAEFRDVWSFLRQSAEAGPQPGFASSPGARRSSSATLPAVFEGQLDDSVFRGWSELARVSLEVSEDPSDAAEEDAEAPDQAGFQTPQRIRAPRMPLSSASGSARRSPEDPCCLFPDSVIELPEASWTRVPHLWGCYRTLAEPLLAHASGSEASDSQAEVVNGMREENSQVQACVAKLTPSALALHLTEDGAVALHGRGLEAVRSVRLDGLPELDARRGAKLAGGLVVWEAQQLPPRFWDHRLLWGAFPRELVSAELDTAFGTVSLHELPLIASWGSVSGVAARELLLEERLRRLEPREEGKSLSPDTPSPPSSSHSDSSLSSSSLAELRTRLGELRDLREQLERLCSARGSSRAASPAKPGRASAAAPLRAELSALLEGLLALARRRLGAEESLAELSLSRLCAAAVCVAGALEPLQELGLPPKQLSALRTLRALEKELSGAGGSAPEAFHVLVVLDGESSGDPRVSSFLEKELAPAALRHQASLSVILHTHPQARWLRHSCDLVVDLVGVSEPGRAEAVERVLRRNIGLGRALGGSPARRFLTLLHDPCPELLRRLDPALLPDPSLEELSWIQVREALEEAPGSRERLQAILDGLLSGPADRASWPSLRIAGFPKLLESARPLPELASGSDNSDSDSDSETDEEKEGGEEEVAEERGESSEGKRKHKRKAEANVLPSLARAASALPVLQRSPSVFLVKDAEGQERLVVDVQELQGGELAAIGERASWGRTAWDLTRRWLLPGLALVSAGWLARSLWMRREELRTRWLRAALLDPEVAQAVSGSAAEDPALAAAAAMVCLKQCYNVLGPKDLFTSMFPDVKIPEMKIPSPKH